MKDIRFFSSRQSRKNSDAPSIKSFCGSSRSYRNRKSSSDRIVIQFCHDTSLHGLKYVGQKNRHISERIFWLIAFIGGIALAGYLISDVYYKYKSNPVFVAFGPNELPISRIPFPAITVCNMNRIKKEVALQIERNTTSSDPEVKSKAVAEMELMKSICGAHPSLSKLMAKAGAQEEAKGKGQGKGDDDSDSEIDYQNQTIIDFLYKASQPCDEMIKACFFGDLEVICPLFFAPVVTESGMCCTVNMMPTSLLLRFPKTMEHQSWKQFIDNETMDQYNREEYAAYLESWKSWDYSDGFIMEDPTLQAQPFNAQTSGMSNSLSVLLFPDLDNYYCTTGDSTGFLLAAHKPIDYPHPFDYGLAIPPGVELYGVIIPDLTQAESSIAGVAISSRSCYFSNEYPLKYYKVYTDSNCVDECISDFTIQECGCAQYFQPRDNLTRVCGPNDFGCIANISILLLNKEEYCDKCFPLCNELEYRISSSLSSLQNYSMLWPPDTTHENITSKKWYGQPVTIINVFYGERTLGTKVRKRLFLSTDLIANVGGLLGLCLGFSGLSLIEVIYFCTIRTWFQRRKIKGTVLRMIKNFINMILKSKSEDGVAVVPSPTLELEISPDKNGSIRFISNSNKGPGNGTPIYWDPENNLNRLVERNKYYFP